MIQDGIDLGFSGRDLKIIGFGEELGIDKRIWFDPHI